MEQFFSFFEFLQKSPRKLFDVVSVSSQPNFSMNTAAALIPALLLLVVLVIAGVDSATKNKKTLFDSRRGSGKLYMRPAQVEPLF